MPPSVAPETLEYSGWSEKKTVVATEEYPKVRRNSSATITGAISFPTKLLQNFDYIIVLI